MKKYIHQLPRPSTFINIISWLPVFTSLQSNWITPYYLSHSAKSQIIYEDSEVYPIFNLELFRTSILKDMSGLSCCYKVVVKVKVPKTIISARMTHFAISPFHHLDISTFQHFNISIHYHSKNTIVFVSLFHFQYHIPHKNKCSLLISSSS